MKTGIACLVGAYVLSQFYRAFLAVLTPDLGRDLGATAGDLAWASGLWFLAFAAMQIPVGAPAAYTAAVRAAADRLVAERLLLAEDAAAIAAEAERPAR